MNNSKQFPPPSPKRLRRARPENLRRNGFGGRGPRTFAETAAAGEAREPSPKRLRRARPENFRRNGGSRRGPRTFAETASAGEAREPSPKRRQQARPENFRRNGGSRRGPEYLNRNRGGRPENLCRRQARPGSRTRNPTDRLTGKFSKY